MFKLTLFDADWEISDDPEENQDLLQVLFSELDVAQDIELDNEIIVIGERNFWNGKQLVVNRLHSNNISSVFHCFRDVSDHSWYVDEENELCCDYRHHDGTNHYTFRMLKAGLDVDDFYDGLHNSNNPRVYAEENTVSIGGIARKAEEDYQESFEE